MSTARARGEDDLRAELMRMNAELRHRGPDDEGVWVDSSAGVALAHRRLSIVDLSPGGHQPMVSPCGRYVLVFNGEIYNYEVLRTRLEADGAPWEWRGHSDTEVLVAAFARWGIETALRSVNGMFALGLWDRQERRLCLARDPVGEKPLYYGWMRGTFLFGSELRALRRHPDWQGEIDRGAVALYMRHNYVPAPHTIYRGISKLLPGTILQLAWGDGSPDRTAETSTFWSAREVASAGMNSPFTGSEVDAVDSLESLLRDAVGLRMRADVPVGAFLSGGVDSSLVVALMREHSQHAPRTFSIGFDDPRYDEASHARAVAKHLETDHTELRVTVEEALSVVPRLATMYDEPFADSSQIPTFLVAQLARRSVTVALSGDGGDELFGGYNRYFWTRRLWRGMAPVPRPVRRLVARALRSVPPHQWDRVMEPAMRAVPARYRTLRPGDNLHRVAGLLGASRQQDLYRRLVSHWDPPSRVVRDAVEPPYLLSESADAVGGDASQRMMLLDLLTYLPDDILVKLDRATMAVSLEARVPLLDPRVIAFAWQLPSDWRAASGTGKRLLRQVLYRHVPRELIERPKMGFGVPLDAWLRGPLRDWAAALLEPGRLRREGFMRPEVVMAMWQHHLSGQSNDAYLLWDVLMFQSWLDAQT